MRLFRVFYIKLPLFGLFILLFHQNLWAYPERLQEEQHCSYPASAVVKLELEGVSGNGTAFLIDSHHLLTNAHLATRTHRLTITSRCLTHLEPIEARVVNTWFDRNNIATEIEREIYGIDGEMIPTSEDWAVIEIDNPLGDQLGFFSVLGSERYGVGDSKGRELLEEAFLCEAIAGGVKSGLNSCSLGYPRLYRPQMTHSSADVTYHVKGMPGGSSGYTANFRVLGGSSGSPVYYFNPNTQVAVAFGLIQGGVFESLRGPLRFNYITEINEI